MLCRIYLTCYMLVHRAVCDKMNQQLTTTAVLADGKDYWMMHMTLQCGEQLTGRVITEWMIPRMVSVPATRILRHTSRQYWTDETDFDGNNETTDVTIPILDEPITPGEVHEQSRKMKPDKASGPDGIPPGVFTLLPAQWLCSLATLFNNSFLPGIYLTHG